MFDDGGQCGRGLGMPKTRWKCLRDLEGTLCDEVMNSQCMTVFQILYIYIYIYNTIIYISNAFKRFNRNVASN